MRRNERVRVYRRWNPKTTSLFLSVQAQLERVLIGSRFQCFLSYKTFSGYF